MVADRIVIVSTRQFENAILVLKDRYLSGVILPLIGSGLPVSMSEIWSDLASDRNLRPSLRDKKAHPFRRSFSFNDVSSYLLGRVLFPSSNRSHHSESWIGVIRRSQMNELIT